MVGGMLAFSAGLAATALLASRPSPSSPPSPLSTAQLFDKIAPSYDQQIGREELAMGLPLFRRMLLRHCRSPAGNSGAYKVLEVHAGTGRNLRYYDKAVDLTLADQSSGMVSECRRKIDQSGGAVSPAKTAVVVADSHKLPFGDETFDCVVDTFGLCSCADPQQALAEMVRVLKDGGKLLLLEHGRSSHAWLNRLLDNAADSHREKWGCTFNRDLAHVISRCSDDHVMEGGMHRWHLGTTIYYVGTKRTRKRKEPPPPTMTENANDN